jgi:hypothetical protein
LFRDFRQALQLGYSRFVMLSDRFIHRQQRSEIVRRFAIFVKRGIDCHCKSPG